MYTEFSDEFLWLSVSQYTYTVNHDSSSRRYQMLRHTGTYSAKI